MSGFPFPGPIAPESNPPIEPQFFQPSVFTIQSLSYGISTTVTTYPSYFGVNNNYVLGQQVRFDIPFFNGAQQLNGQTGEVIDLVGSNEFTVDIDSRNFDPFIASPSYVSTPPQVVAIGDFNSGVISTMGRVSATAIPGSFINTSPFASGA